MGNRAVIQFDGPDAKGLGIYLHWNGGMDTVKPMLDVAREYGVRADNYGVARVAQMFGNFFGGTDSIGVGIAEGMDRDNMDNGTYIVDSKFNIVDRLYAPTTEQNVYPYDEMVTYIKEINDQFFVRKD